MGDNRADAGDAGIRLYGRVGGKICFKSAEVAERESGLGNFVHGASQADGYTATILVMVHAGD